MSAASLQGHRGSADTLNKAPDLGRDGSTLPTHDAQACELAGFLPELKALAPGWKEAIDFFSVR